MSRTRDSSCTRAARLAGSSKVAPSVPCRLTRCRARHEKKRGGPPLHDHALAQVGGAVRARVRGGEPVTLSVGARGVALRYAWKKLLQLNNEVSTSLAELQSALEDELNAAMECSRLKDTFDKLYDAVLKRMQIVKELKDKVRECRAEFVDGGPEGKVWAGEADVNLRRRSP